MAIRLTSVALRIFLILAAALALGACTESGVPKADRPLPFALTAKMKQLGMEDTAPIFIRIYKESSEFEVWKQRSDGKYGLLKTYSICKWSGDLGPKKEEGDRQAPEGFYTVTPAQMNPNSNYYLSFNIGYPNAYDRSYGRTGSNLMVHGACSSAGCYSMTDESAGEIFALARDAFRGGQRAFQIQAFPFRMTPENLAKHHDDPNMPFWRMLKVGYDHFEVTRVPPKVDVCDRSYVFDADAGNANFSPIGPCPSYVVPAKIADAVAAKEAADQVLYAKALAKLPADTPPVNEKSATVETPATKRVASTAKRQAIVEAKAETAADTVPDPIPRADAHAVPAAARTSDVGNVVKRRFKWSDEEFTPTVTADKSSQTICGQPIVLPAGSRHKEPAERTAAGFFMHRPDGRLIRRSCRDSACISCPSRTGRARCAAPCPRWRDCSGRWKRQPRRPRRPCR